MAGRERGGPGDDDADDDRRIPIWDSCSTRSGVRVAALLRWLLTQPQTEQVFAGLAEQESRGHALRG
ncbi:hypothetical protein ACWEBX_39095 [Streptomyces sp. NPDC005070]